jgi:hypothetical protein
LLHYDGNVEETFALNFGNSSSSSFIMSCFFSLVDDDPFFICCCCCWSLVTVTTEERFGEMLEHELKPGGKDMPVTNDNRQGTSRRT